MKRQFLFLMVLVCAVTSAAILVAERKARAGQDAICEVETDRYCWNVEPGHGRVWQCLQKYDANLSAPCRRMVTAHLARPEPTDDIQKACKSDRKKFCRYVDWSDSRVNKCLKIHDVEISDKCRAALPR